MSRAAPPRAGAIAVYVAVLGAGAVALTLAAADAGLDGPERGAPATVPVFLGLLVAAEWLLVRFRYRGEINALNLIEAVLAPVLFAFPVAVAVALVVASQLIAGGLRRNHPVKVAFNVAQWALATAVGGHVLAALLSGPAATDGPSSGPLGALPGAVIDLEAAGAVLVALAAVGLVNQLSFTGVLAITNGQRPRQVLSSVAPVILPGWVLGWVANSLMGLLFVAAYVANPAFVALAAVPLAVLHLAYRGYAGTRSDRVRLAGLHHAAEALNAPLDPEDGIEPFLEEVAQCFEARGALLAVSAPGGGRHVHCFDVAGGHRHHREAPADRSLAAALMAEPAARRLRAGEPGAGAPGVFMDQSGWRDCLAAPLVDGGRTVGVLAVFDQAGLEGFEAGELAVVEALARETAATLAKGRLLSEILEERRALARIVGSTSDGICTVAADGTVLSWNPAFEQLTGRLAAELVGVPGGLDTLDVTTADGTPVALARWAATAGSLPTELVVHRVDGSRRRLACAYTEVVADPAAGDAETLAGDPDAPAGRHQPDTLVVVARDVTGAEEVAELRQEVGRLTEADAARRAVVDQLQAAVMPPQPEIPGVELAVSYLASDPEAPTGGDLYDWQVLPTGELHLAVVDVLGHGVSATRAALDVVHTLRVLALDGCPLEDLVAKADLLLAAQHPDLVATAIVLRHDPHSGRTLVCAGGHPPALVVAPDGQVEQLAATGTAIGWPGAGSDTLAERVLAPGESLVLYTDGLVEARKDILEGMEQLVRHASQLAASTAGDLAGGLLSRALEGAARLDDTLVLALRRAPVAVDDAAERWRIDPEPAEAAATRRALRSWLAARGVAGTDLYDLQLAASELLANGVEAARTSVTLHVEIAGGAVMLEVGDDGPGHAGLEDLGHQPSGTASEHGRGLFLVRSVSDSVEVLSTSAGSVVRCLRTLVSSPAGAGERATRSSR